MSAEESTEKPRKGGRPTVVLIGEGDLSDETERALEAADARVVRLCTPDEDDVREALEDKRVERVAVVARDDAIVLRFALMVRGVSDDVPLLLTIFDPTMAEQVRDMVAHTEVDLDGGHRRAVARGSRASTSASPRCRWRTASRSA